MGTRRLGRAAYFCAFIGALAGSAACSDTACTQIGCADGIPVTTEFENMAWRSGDVTAIACVGRDCAEQTYGAEELPIDGQIGAIAPKPVGSHGDRVDVSLVLRDEVGKTLFASQGVAELVESMPNGRSCGPICIGAAPVILDSNGAAESSAPASTPLAVGSAPDSPPRTDTVGRR